MIRMPKLGTRINTVAGAKIYEQFAADVMEVSDKVDFKISARGWAYIFEGENLITKDEIDRCEILINKCRMEGLLAPDFTAEDSSRIAVGIEQVDDPDPESHADLLLGDVLDHYIEKYTPKSFWDDLGVYIEIVVEKIDLVGLFAPIASQYSIPITNARGWSDYNSRYRICQRMVEHSDRQKVILYCGDYDPPGLLIEEKFKSHLQTFHKVTGWRAMYDESLTVHRFGLNRDFILEHGFTWIDNLITARGKDLSDPKHPSYKAFKVAEYIERCGGSRKCESNVLVTNLDLGRQLLQDTIDLYIPRSYVDQYEVDLSEQVAPLREAVNRRLN